MSKKMEKLSQQLDVIKGKIERFSTYLDGFESHKKYNELKVRRAKLELCLDEFESVQREIEIINKSVDNEERYVFETYFFETCARADNILEEYNKSSVKLQSDTKIVDTNSQIKLPPINIPTFGGSYDQWHDFFDLFQSLIDKNKELNSVQKLHYLKSALQGDALQIIQAIETTEQNYCIALDLLKTRYENKKMILLNHVKALYDIPQLQKENFSGLRQFFDTFQRHIRALKSMGYTDGALFDILLIYLLSSKLDKVTHIEWEKRALEKEELLTYEDFRQFLQHKCNLLESLHRDLNPISQSHSGGYKFSNVQFKSTQFNKTQNSFVSTQIKGNKYKSHEQCTICKKNHRFFACEKFLNMSIQERINTVKRLRLCLNCLGYNHTYSQCQLGPCKKCSRKHNTLLHLDEMELPTNEIHENPQPLPYTDQSNLNQTTQVTQSNFVQDTLYSHTNY